MAPPPPPRPPPSLLFPLQHPRLLSNYAASTATLTSLTPAATRVHFTGDTASSSDVSVRGKLKHRQRGPEPTPRPRTHSNPSSSKAPSPLIRFLQWGKRRDESVTPLIGENVNWKLLNTINEKVDTTPRLRALRAQMATRDIDYIIIPSEDGHLSEYTSPSERRREWISGFSGSTGTAIISKHSAYLFTDSRYWNRAQRELDANWSLQKVGWDGTKDWLEWIILCPRGSTVGVDSRMISHACAMRLFKGLNRRGSTLIHPRQNLLDFVWADRPERPMDAVYVQPEEYASKGAQEKLSEIRAWIRSQNVVVEHAERGGGSPRTTTATSATAITAMFVSSLPGVAHMLNLRGSDGPVFMAYLLVALDKAVLFVDLEKISPEVKKYLDACGVSVRAYKDVWAYLGNKEWGEGKIAITPNTPHAIPLVTGVKAYHLSPSNPGAFRPQIA